MKISRLFALAIFIFSGGILFAQKNKIDKRQLKTEVFEIIKDEPGHKEVLYKQSYKALLLTEGVLINNIKNGEWKQYYINGELARQGAYLNGKKNGKWLFFKDSKIASESYYTLGEMDSSISYFTNRKISEEFYHKHGESYNKAYHPSGKLLLEIKKDSTGNGFMEFFFENGKPHRKFLTMNGYPYTNLYTLDAKGKILDGGNLQNGNGKFIMYERENGILKPNLIYNYKNGLPHGKFYREKFGSTIEEGLCKEGFKTGIWMSPYTNSKVECPFLIPNTYYISQKFQYNYEVDFLGGYSGIQEFIEKTLIYPEFSKRLNITGKVVVEFLVNIDGEVEEIKIVEKVDPDLDQEAYRIISQMPLWNPGINNGKPYSLRTELTINFFLD
jgi:TonB family protein